MALLEIVQTHYVSASIRLEESTATQVDQYAAFLHATADEVDRQASYIRLRQGPRISGVSTSLSSLGRLCQPCVSAKPPQRRARAAHIRAPSWRGWSPLEIEP